MHLYAASKRTFIIFNGDQHTSGALGGIKTDKRFVGVRVTQDAGADTVNDGVTPFEVTKRNGFRIGGDIRHLFVFSDTVTRQ